MTNRSSHDLEGHFVADAVSRRARGLTREIGFALALTAAAAISVIGVAAHRSPDKVAAAQKLEPLPVTEVRAVAP